MSGRTQTDLVLGTAGHIDHGKSSLVLALTGTDPTVWQRRSSAASPSSWASRAWRFPTAPCSAWWTCRATSASCAR